MEVSIVEVESAVCSKFFKFISLLFQAAFAEDSTKAAEEGREDSVAVAVAMTSSANRMAKLPAEV